MRKEKEFGTPYNFTKEEFRAEIKKAEDALSMPIVGN